LDISASDEVGVEIMGVTGFGVEIRVMVEVVFENSEPFGWEKFPKSKLQCLNNVVRAHGNIAVT